jgi:hypothetical protein
MASMRKLRRNAEHAAAAYRAAAADVITATLNERTAGREPSDSPDVQRLRRRSGAYHAQWLAAERRVEENLSREVAS